VMLIILGPPVTVPSLARVYDYYLEGSLNSAIDRHFALDLQAVCPALPRIARHQRLFLTQSMRVLLNVGVRQFIDLGSGLPAAGHAHHIAQAYDPNCVVVYIDNDPLVVSQGAAILRSDAKVRIMHADIRRPVDILQHSAIGEIIDPSQPVGINMIGVLEFIPDDDDPAELIAAYQEVSDVETYTALAMVTHNDDPQQVQRLAGAGAILRGVGATLEVRSPRILAHWLASTTVLDPGVQPAILWAASGAPPEPDGDLVQAALARRQRNG
jgi:hypothetical protein